MCAVIIVRYCLKYSDNTLGKQQQKDIFCRYWDTGLFLRFCGKAEVYNDAAQSIRQILL